MPSFPPPPSNQQQQQQQKVWYSANCHCRLIRLRLRILPLYPSSSPSPAPPSTSITSPSPTPTSPTEYSNPYNCNCSICTKNGYLNIYPSSYTHDIEWLSGREELRSYEYGACERRHMFCPRCGSSVALFNFFGGESVEEGGRRPMVGVNVCFYFSFFFFFLLGGGFVLWGEKGEKG